MNAIVARRVVTFGDDKDRGLEDLPLEHQVVRILTEFNAAMMPADLRLRLEPRPNPVAFDTLIAHMHRQAKVARFPSQSGPALIGLPGWALTKSAPTIETPPVDEPAAAPAPSLPTEEASMAAKKKAQRGARAKPGEHDEAVVAAITTAGEALACGKLAKSLGITASQMTYVLKGLRACGRIRSIGRGAGTRWVLGDGAAPPPTATTGNRNAAPTGRFGFVVSVDLPNCKGTLSQDDLRALVEFAARLEGARS